MCYIEIYTLYPNCSILTNLGELMWLFKEQEVFHFDLLYLLHLNSDFETWTGRTKWSATIDWMRQFSVCPTVEAVCGVENAHNGATYLFHVVKRCMYVKKEMRRKIFNHVFIDVNLSSLTLHCSRCAPDTYSRGGELNVACTHIMGVQRDIWLKFGIQSMHLGDALFHLILYNK